MINTTCLSHALLHVTLWLVCVCCSGRLMRDRSQSSFSVSYKNMKKSPSLQSLDNISIDSYLMEDGDTYSLLERGGANINEFLQYTQVYSNIQWYPLFIERGMSYMWVMWTTKIPLRHLLDKNIMFLHITLHCKQRILSLLTKKSSPKILRLKSCAEIRNILLKTLDFKSSYNEQI